jgi:hypothetical protein
MHWWTRACWWETIRHGRDYQQNNRIGEDLKKENRRVWRSAEDKRYIKSLIRVKGQRLVVKMWIFGAKEHWYREHRVYKVWRNPKKSNLSLKWAG